MKALLAVLLAGCIPELEEPDIPDNPHTDYDGDGYSELDDDCNDGDASVFPGADERCNHVDDDCDGVVDEEPVDGQSWYADADGDGFGSDELTSPGCAQPSGSADQGGDCDDDDGNAWPGAPDTWYDGVDSDCAGDGDNDADGDGYAATEHGGTDCDDADPAIHPDAIETWYDGVDADCDGASDYDADADGHDATIHDGDDCDDHDGDVNPDQADAWYDGVDSDCDGRDDFDADGDGWRPPAWGGPDCDDDDASIAPGADDAWYDGIDADCGGDSDYDADGDGFDSDEHGGDDCDDTDARVYVGAPDAWYDDVDSNCDGASDWDADGDGYELGDDCDDSDPAVCPGATETWYDGVDGDCDAANDYDADGDGWASAEYGGGDCDDADADASPDQDEVWYDGVDSDCDGGSDYDVDGDGFDSDEHGGDDCDDTDARAYVGAPDAWYDDVDSNCDGESDWDADGDGYELGDDCDDDDAAVNPAAPEVWYDGVDSDCDGANDYDADGDGWANAEYGGGDCDDGNVDVTTASAWYADSDGDGFGDADSTVEACTVPSDYTADNTDCDDGDDAVNPDATEVCGDVVDDDCDGAAGDCMAWGETSASNADMRLIGEESVDVACQVGYAGDLDGDGLADLMVGATLQDAGATNGGALYIVYGPGTGDLDLSAADAKWLAEGTDDDVGRSTARLEDATGEGDLALLVGAYRSGLGASNAGAAYLLVGPGTGTHSLAEADAVFVGIAEDDRAGYGLAGGDFDADGISDAVISAYGESTAGTSAGAVYVVFGPTSGTVSLSTADAQVLGAATGDYLGYAIAAGSDVNGDGVDDLVLGAIHESTIASSSGAVYVLVGPHSGAVDLDSADAVWTGEYEDDRLGTDLDIADDVDGDGHADVVMGSSGARRCGTGCGAAYLVSGASTGIASCVDATAILEGESAGDYAGEYVSSAGDVNGDGHSDVLVGAYLNDGDAADSGSAYLLLGPFTGTVSLSSADTKVTGEESGDRLSHVTRTGDVDGNGFDDILVGARYNSAGGYAAGAAYLFYSVGY